MLKRLEFTFLFLALIAEIIGTVGGFGSSVFFVPIANFYFDFQSVLGITALFHVASNLSKITLFRKGLDKMLIYYLGLPAVLFVLIGGFVSKFINPFYLEFILGIFLVVLSLVFLLFRDYQFKKGKKQAVVGGILSGLFAGILGTGGAVRGLTMAAFNLKKGVFVATSAVIDFGVDFSRTVVYYHNGYIKTEHLVYIPFLVVIAIVGSWLGKLILNKIPQDKFRRFSLLLILGIGLLTFLRAISVIWKG